MQSWLPNKPLEQLQIGEAVVIYYDPDHPEKSVLGDPSRILQNETISIILAAIGTPSFILIVVAWKNRKKMQHKKVPHGATS